MLNLSVDNSMNRVIILLDDVDRLAIHALQYAKAIAKDIIAFSMVVDKDSEAALLSQWNEMDTGIPYIICYSPYYGMAESLLGYIKSPESGYTSEDQITIVLPMLFVNKWWQKLLHNDGSKYLIRELSKYENIAVEILPYQLGR